MAPKHQISSFWRPLGKILGAFGVHVASFLGAFWEHFGTLGVSLEVFGARCPQELKMTPPKSTQGPPKKEENGTGAPQKSVSGHHFWAPKTVLVVSSCRRVVVVVVSSCPRVVVSSSLSCRRRRCRIVVSSCRRRHRSVVTFVPP